MAKLTTIPPDLQNVINSFFDAQTAQNYENELWDMFEEFISSKNSDAEQNASKSFTYRKLTNLLFSLEPYFEN